MYVEELSHAAQGILGHEVQESNVSILRDQRGPIPDFPSFSLTSSWGKLVDVRLAVVVSRMAN